MIMGWLHSDSLCVGGWVPTVLHHMRESCASVKTTFAMVSFARLTYPTTCCRSQQIWSSTCVEFMIVACLLLESGTKPAPCIT